MKQSNIIINLENKRMTVFLFVLLITGTCFGQKNILYTRWERNDYDSTNKYIPVNNNIFDVHSFTIQDSGDSLIYWPVAECYLFSGLVNTCKFNFPDSVVLITYDRNYYDSITKTWDKKHFSEYYNFSFSISNKTNQFDSNEFLFMLGGEKLKKRDMHLTLTSLTNNQTSRYNSYILVQDRAFRKLKKTITRINKRKSKKGTKVN